MISRRTVRQRRSCVYGIHKAGCFNTSGLLYRSLGLKDRLAGMTEEEMLALLSSDGMLVKRPILIGDGFVLIGFKEAQWDERIK